MGSGAHEHKGNISHELLTTIMPPDNKNNALTLAVIIKGSFLSCQINELHCNAVSMLIYLKCHFMSRSPPSYTVSLIGIHARPTVLKQVQRISYRFRWSFTSTLDQYNGNPGI